MKELDEETALAVLFSNTRTKKRNLDLLTIARSFEYLVNLYGSQKAIANKIGISTEMVREFLTVLKLPQEVQNYISKREIDSVDIVKELAALRDVKKQISAAELLVESSSKDVRDIKRLLKDTDLKVEEAKKIILEHKPKAMHVFIIDFSDEMYKAVHSQAKKLKTSPAELVREIVRQWLYEKKLS